MKLSFLSMASPNKCLSLVNRFSPRTNTKMPMSSWVCHFHISKVQNHIHVYIWNNILMYFLFFFFFFVNVQKVLKQKQLDVESVVSSLNKQYANRKKELKLDVIDLEIQST